jgi:quercetin dioxygenase-like cupin family protein
MSMTSLRTIPLLTVLVAAASAASDAPVKRTLLQKFAVPATAPHECVFALAEVAPGASIGRHTHPGVETGYVVAGSFVLIVEGEAPRVLRANDSYRIEAGKVHDGRNDGKAVVKIVGTWIVEQGRPLSTPVAAKS